MKIIRNFLFLFVYLVTNIDLDGSIPNEKVYAPIYHTNGSIAWTGLQTSPFYHDNLSILWSGLSDPYSIFSYKNGKTAWSGLLFSECGYKKEKASVYYMNGQKAWGGASRQNLYYDHEPSYIYHENGLKAWGGALSKDSLFFNNETHVYHMNGNLLWKGVFLDELSYSSEPAYIYHANGEIVWKGGFIKNGNSTQSSSVYYDNGRLAWSGHATDPIFDPYGNISIGRADSVVIDIGFQSKLYVYANGKMLLFVNLGNGNTLKFTNDGKEPEFWIWLDYPAYTLVFSPHFEKPVQLQAYDRAFYIQN